MGITETIDMALVNRGRRAAKLLGIVLFAAAACLEAAVVICLRQAPAIVHAEDPANIEWSADALASAVSDFDDDTVDCILIFLIRLMATSTLIVIAVHVGMARLDDLVEAAEEDGATAPLVCPPCGSGDAPLLINGGSGEDASTTTRANQGAQSGFVRGEHLESFQRKKAADARKNLAIGTLFAVSTGSQVFVGIKCISFEGTWLESSAAMTLQGALLGTSVLLINLEAWLANRIVHALTAEEGFLVPEFHQHRLFFHGSMPNHYCDMCHAVSKHMYRCSVCDFDACPACFNKKDKATGEGVMRGDKGVRDVLEIGRVAYLARGMRLVAPHLPLLLVALSALFGNSVVNVFLPNFQGQIFDHVIAANHACGADPTDDACHRSRQSFFETVWLYLGLSVAIGLLSIVKSLSFQIVARRIGIWVRKKLFRKLLRQDIAFFDGMRTGDLQSRLSEDVRAMVDPIYSTLGILLSNAVLLAGGVIMCFVTSWRLSMLAFTTILPMMHATSVYAEWSGNINRRIYQHLSDAMSRMGEVINNIRTVRALSTEALEAVANDTTLQLALSAGIRDALFGSLTSAFNDYLDLGAGVMILWYGGVIAMSPHGSITAGKLITFQLYWNMINNAIQELNDMVNSFTRAAGAAERVLSLDDLEPDIEIDTGSPADVVVGQWSVVFDDVHFRYQMRPEQLVLRGISFAVPEGTVAALVGRSGGGKSTLIHLILRYYDPTAGRVMLGGVDLRELNLTSVHRRVGVVSQETQLFNNTIGENVAYGAGEHTRAELVEALKAAQAWKFVSEFDDGLATRVGERGTRLSGGQKQRIAIARCLLRKPKLLLLDEATSALDAESEAQVQKALDGLIWGGNRTCVLVAHRLSTVVNAHSIVVVDKGTAVEQGSHTRLLEQGGVYASLVAHQLQKQAEQISDGQAKTGTTQPPADGVDALFDIAAGASRGGEGVQGAASDATQVDPT